MAEPMLPVHPHIGVVVARHEADPGGIAEGLKPGGGGGEFVMCRDVHDVARQRHVIGGGRHDVRGDRRGHRHGVHAVPVEAPVEHADRPLQREMPPRGAHGQGTEMKVREMGEAEYRHVLR